MDKQRLFAWWQKTKESINRGKWWLFLGTVLLWFVRGVVEDRFFHSINSYLDSQAPGAFAHIRAVLFYSNWWRLPLVGLLTALLFFIVRAFFASQPGIVGNADLMIQELELSDLKISPDMAYYEVDVAAFARMEIASLDKPRTVKYFEIELTAPDGTEYHAKSEYEVGNYDHVHDVTTKDDWGMTSHRTVREPMEDLAAKLRVPMQPSTHVGRAWVRFEIPGVRQGHEPVNCQIKIFAVDPANKRHEITTDAMKVVKVDEDHQYAAASLRKASI